MKFIPLSEFTATPPTAISVDVEPPIVIVWESATEKPSTLAEWKEFTRAKLYAIASAKIGALTAEYHPTEQVGWFAKLREANDYQETQDPGLCPNLLAIATLGGRTLQSVVNTVLAKAAELQSQVNQIDAERGRLCDLVAAAETVSEVQAISWLI